MNTTMNDEKVAARIRELQADMAALVVSGDLTPEQANEWVNTVADRLNRDGAWS